MNRMICSFLPTSDYAAVWRTFTEEPHCCWVRRARFEAAGQRLCPLITLQHSTRGNSGRADGRRQEAGEAPKRVVAEGGLQAAGEEIEQTLPQPVDQRGREWRIVGAVGHRRA